MSKLNLFINKIKTFCNFCKPKVSIIMPAYNSDKYITKAILSILNQTFTDFEFIIIDDGSTDSTLSIVNSYAKRDKRIKIVNKNHTNAGDARNLGISIAKGDFLLFLDSDDFFDSQLLELSYNTINKFKADICVFKANCYDSKTNNIFEAKWSCNAQLCPACIPFSRKSNLKNIFAFTTPAPWNKIFRKSFIKNKNIKFQSVLSSNDLSFVFLCLSEAAKIVVIDIPLVYYRINHGYSSQQQLDSNYLSFYRALLFLKNELKERLLYDELKQPFINYALECCIYNLFTLQTESAFCSLYNRLKEEIFRSLEILDKTENYFICYSSNNFNTMQEIMKLDFPAYINKHNLFRKNEI